MKYIYMVSKEWLHNKFGQFIKSNRWILITTCKHMMFTARGWGNPIWSNREYCNESPLSRNHVKCSRSNGKPIRSTFHRIVSSTATIKCAAMAVQVNRNYIGKKRDLNIRYVEGKHLKLCTVSQTVDTEASNRSPNFVITMSPY